MAAARTISNYRVYCETEGAFVTAWGADAPTTCPHNAGHVITPELTTVVDTVSSSTVKISSIEYGGTVQGFYRADGGTVDASGAAGTVKFVDVSYPIPISAYGITLLVSAANVGDKVDVLLTPNMSVGALVQPAPVGTTTFSVSPTVSQVMKTGFEVQLDDGAGHAEDLGRVLAVDASAGLLTSELPSTVNFDAGTTTVVLTSIYIARNAPIMSIEPLRLGYSAMGAKPIPTSAVCRIRYTNVAGGDKMMGYLFEYAY